MHNNKNVRMKVYPNDDHALASPETSVDVLNSMVNFLINDNVNE